MAFNWGEMAGGMAKTWNSGAIGGAINQSVATSREEDAVNAAAEKRDAALKALDAQRGATQGVEGGQVKQALPTQADGVDAVSGAASGGAQPISDAQYAARKQAIQTDYDNAKKQARIDYYKYRGMDAERMKAEDELAQSKWHQGMVDKYNRIVDGDPAEMKELVGYMNATMGNGSQLVQNEDGSLTLVGANGQPIQANFKPSMAQINSAFSNYYNAAKFFHDGNFEGMLDRSKAMQSMALGTRAADLADKKFDFDKLMANENVRLKMKELGLDEAKLRQTYEIFQLGMKNDNAQAAIKREFEAGENEKRRKFEAGENAKGRALDEKKAIMGHAKDMAVHEENVRHHKATEAIDTRKADAAIAAAGPKEKWKVKETQEGDFFVWDEKSGKRMRVDLRGQEIPDGFTGEEFAEELARVSNSGLTASVTRDKRLIYKVPGIEDEVFPSFAAAKKAKKQYEAEQKKTAIPTPKGR